MNWPLFLTTFLIVNILGLRDLAANSYDLSFISGPAAEATMEHINLVCGRERRDNMDETFSCPTSAMEQLQDMVVDRNQSVVNAAVGFISQIPEETRSVLFQNHCKQHKSNLDLMFQCYNQNAPQTLWTTFSMAEMLPRNIRRSDCIYPATEGAALPGIAKLGNDPEGLALCLSFAEQVKNVNLAFTNYQAQTMIRSGLGIACSVASGSARIAVNPSGNIAASGKLPSQCFPKIPNEQLHQPIPYVPRTNPEIPGFEETSDTDQLSSSRTGLWPVTEGVNSICMTGFNWGQDGRDRTYGEVRSEVCPHYESFDPTSAFSSDVFRVLSRIEAADYLELLRLEAVARTVRSARIQLGNSAELSNIPAPCSGVSLSYQNALRAPLSQEEERRQSIIQNAEYPQAIKAAALRIKNTLVPEVQLLKSRDQERSQYERRIRSMMAERYQTSAMRTQLMEDLQEVQAERSSIASRLREIEYQISADFARYPVLMLNHDPSEKVWDSIPSVELMANASNPAAQYITLNLQLQADIMSQIGRICNPAEVTNDQLLGDPELVSLVTARYPRFNVLNQCLQDMRERTQTTLRVLRFGAALGCAAFGPVGGAVCGGLVMLTGAYVDYEQAQTRLSYESRCRLSMGESEEICSSSDYIQAQTAFNDTIRGIMIDGALEILMPVALGSLKFLSPARIRFYQEALEETPNDFRRIAREIEEEATASAARLPPPVQHLETPPPGLVLNGSNATPIINAADDVPVTPVANSADDIATKPSKVPAQPAQAVQPPTVPNRVPNARVKTAGIQNADPPGPSQSIPTRADRTNTPDGIGTRPPGLSIPNLRLSSTTRRIRNPVAPPPFRTEYEISFPEVNIRFTDDAVGDAQSYLNSADFRAANPNLGDAPILLDDAHQLGSGGTRRVFSLEADNSVVMKVYDGNMPGFSNMSPVERQFMISRMVQRELAMEDLLLQVVDDYRRMGLEPPFTVARIRRDPDLLSRGIIVQDRFTGQTMNTLTRDQLDNLVPPPSGYTPPATTTVSYKGHDRLIDSSSKQFLTSGGISHSELTRIPGIESYQRFIDSYDSQIRGAISNEHGIALSARSGPNSFHEFGLDYGHGYGNVMFDPDAPAGASQVIIYDW
jgi:hypothetical protein